MALTISFERAAGYPKEHLGNVFSEGENRVTDKLYCVWDDRIALASELLGSVTANTVNLPEEYTVGTEFSTIYAKTVDIEGIGFDKTLLQFTKAALTVTYGKLDYEVTNNPIGPYYVSESLEPAAEFITLSKDKLYWSNDQTSPLTDIEAPAKVIRMVDWVYTIHGKTRVPDWVWTHIGKINDSSVTSSTLNRTFAERTLLCGNPSLERNWDTDGTPRWQVTTRLTYRPDTWNKFPRASANGTLSMSSIYDGAGTEKQFYETANFSSIIEI